MLRFLSKNKKYVSLALLISTVFSFFAPFSALAADDVGGGSTAASAEVSNPLSWIAGKAVLYTSAAISVVLSALFGMLLAMEAKIVDITIDPSYFSFTNTSIVITGWTITRDIANMLFILVLLVIAFSTVLRFKSWAVDQLLWKVIVAALIINFSLVMAGFVIDFAQMLTTFFLKQSIGDSFSSITVKMASSMKITNFYNPAPASDIMPGITQFGASLVAAVVGIILTLGGLIVTVFVFGALAVFLIVRIVAIWFLLIIAPIVWILWIIPTTSGHFFTWWKEFIKWTFFAPIYAFLMYISLSIFDVQGNISNGVMRGTLPAGWNQAAAGLTTASMPSAIFQWILVIGMMFGSLVVALKLGVHGAKFSHETLKGWGTGTRDWAGRRLRRSAAQWTQPLPPVPPATPGAAPLPRPGFLKRAGAAWRKTGAALGGVAAATPGLRGAYIGYLTDEQKAFSESYNKYKGIDPAILEQIDRSGSLVQVRDKAAVKQLLIEKDRLKPEGPEMMRILNEAKGYGQEENVLKAISDKMGKDLTAANGYDDAIKGQLVQRADTKGMAKEFLKFFPNMAPVINKKIEDVVPAIDDASQIYEDELSWEVIKELSPKQLKTIGAKGTLNKRQGIEDIIENHYNSLNESEKSFVNNVVDTRDQRRRNEMLNDPQFSEEARRLATNRIIMMTPKWQQEI